MKNRKTVAGTISAIPNHFQYFLIGSLVIQIAGLILFASYEVKAILPEGNSDVLDWIYSNHSFLETLKYSIAAVFGITLLFRRSSKRLRGISFCLIMVFVHLNQPWYILLLTPFYLRSQKAELENPGAANPPDEYDAGSVVILIGLALILGGFVLMSVQLPFPHRVTAVQTYCIHSLSTVFLGTGVLFSGIVLFLPIWAIQKTALSEERKSGLLMIILLVVIFTLFALYAHRTFNSFVNQFHIKHVPLMVSGLLTNFLFLFLAPAETPFYKNLRLGFLHQNLTKRYFWLKFLVLFFGIRHFYFYLINADQNFLTIFLFDIFNILLPFLAFLLLFSFTTKIFRKTRSPGVLKTVVILGLIASLIPSLILVRKDWTLGLKMNRPTTAFYMMNSRRILQFVGINTKHEFSHLLDYFKEEIARTGLEQKQPLTDVFGPQSTEAYSAPGQWSKKPPHIFIYIFDAVYARHLSTYGFRRNTSPNLTQFARDAAVFNHFYSTSSATSQGIASLFTGYYVGNFPHSLKTPRGTLCKSLKARNYQMFLSVLIDTVALSSEKEDCRNRINMSYDRPGTNEMKKIESFMSKYPDRPVFAYFHNTGGHEPWTLPESKKVYGKSRLDIYDALLRESDLKFKHFLDWMKQQGIYDNSIILFSADHGIGLGRHMDLAAYSNLYNVNIQVPFIIRVPGMQPTRVNDVYSLVDVRPTLENLLGIESDDPYHGRSFVNVLQGKRETGTRCIFATATYTDRYAMQCSNGSKVYYLRDLDALEHYNAKSDPYEERPLIQNLALPEFKTIVAPLVRFMSFGAGSYARTP